MKNNCKGATIVEASVLLIFIVIIVLFIAGFCIRYIFGNKQLVDFKQNFNYAYVLSDNNKFEKIKIIAWKDWENSDAVQIIDAEGHPIYTHLRNVKLVHE